MDINFVLKKKKTKTKKEFGQYPTILTSRLVNIVYVLSRILHIKKKSSHLPSFIDDVTLCKAAWVVVTLEVWFLTAAADSETDEDDEDVVVTEDDEVVITRCADRAGGLFGGVWDFVPTSNIDQSNSLLINVNN